MAVFVTDGNERATLAVVRALGRAGINVTVGSDEAASLAGSSRYCARAVRYPSPWKDGKGFQTFLIDEMHRGPYRVLIPMTDLTLGLVAPIRNAVAPRVQVPIPGEATVRLAQDKRRTLLLARQL